MTPLEHVRQVVERSGTSFYWAMKSLPPQRRDAMFAIYAFCREVDDIADEGGTPAEKMAALDEWQADLDRFYEGLKPDHLTLQALSGPVAAFELAKDDFKAIIAGMEMDAKEDIQAPERAVFDQYCDRVACAVGRLSNRVMGAPAHLANPLADALGRALQTTNILRALAEDGRRGRLYLPCNLLRQAGIEATDPALVLAHPNLPQVCAILAGEAGDLFAKARGILGACDRKALRPAIVMMEVYRRILIELEKRGWGDLERPVGPSKIVKLLIALKITFFDASS
jgi:squalene synthase HpnD